MRLAVSYVVILVFLSMGPLSCGSSTGDGDGGGSSTYSTTDAATYLVGYYWVETDDDDGTLNDDGRRIVMYITADTLTEYIQDVVDGTTYTKDADYPYNSIEVWQEQNNSFVLSADMVVLAFGFISSSQIWVWDDDVTDDEIFNRYSNVTELGIILSDG